VRGLHSTELAPPHADGQRGAEGDTIEDGLGFVLGFELICVTQYEEGTEGDERIQPTLCAG
jgi:hypothetical protein